MDIFGAITLPQSLYVCLEHSVPLTNRELNRHQTSAAPAPECLIMRSFHWSLIVVHISLVCPK